MSVNERASSDPQNPIKKSKSVESILEKQKQNELYRTSEKKYSKAILIIDDAYTLYLYFKVSLAE